MVFESMHMIDERIGEGFHDRLVSIIMPVYNDTVYVKEAIMSILGQTYPKWELLLVDDGSTMDIYAAIKDLLSEERIRFIRLPENRTVAGARNAGIAAARGRYLAFLDSDDWWMPEKLEKQVRFMQENNMAMSFTSYRRVLANGQKVGRVLKAELVVDYSRLLKGNCIGCSTVMIDRQQCPDIKMPFMRHEDYITWLNLAKRNLLICGLAEDLVRYRVGNNSLSANKCKSLWWTWKVYRKSQGLSFFRSLLCLGYYIAHGIRKRC